MRSVRMLGSVISAAMALGALGCGSSLTPTPFSDTTGEAKPEQVAYPAGPYGVAEGSIIPNFAFIGYGNAKATQVNTQTINLADFYNPHAFDKTYQPKSGEEDDRLFPMTSGYAMAGKTKPTVLLVDIASVWCGPCNDEANHLLPFKHDLYQNCGGEFLLDLHDSNTPGTTATLQNLKNWTKLYKVDYPAATDPEYRLDAYFAANAFPNNLIIDTTTMKIVHVVAGEVIPGLCSDMQTICGTDADVAVCSDASKGFNCSSIGQPVAACATGSCTQYDFWSTFEAHLDKSRAGCAIK